MRKPYFILFVSFIITVFFLPDLVTGQRYENIFRADTFNWHQLETPHFRVIYQDGETSAAYKTARLLEEHYPVVQELTGGSLRKLPVVLNGMNDLSNGYVTTQYFRIEIEIPRIKSKSMNPADGNWLTTVVPHELVHALHFNNIPSIGISGFIRLFSPDAARSMQFTAPVGMMEGIAVFHESHHLYQIGGRGNHPFFINRFNSAFESSSRWNLSQMLMSPAYSFPRDRHYIGGFEFINWLQYEYGMDVTKKTIEHISKWPFLGYGMALRRNTGKWPSQLYEDFVVKKEQDINHSISQSYLNETYTPLFDNSTEIQRRPVWLDNQHILFHAHGYSTRPGFYLVNVHKRKKKTFFETAIVEDYLLTADLENQTIMYARYHPHIYYQNQYRMRLNRIQYDQSFSVLSSGKIPYSVNDRLHAAESIHDEPILAIQTHHENNLLVTVDSLKLDTLLIPENGFLVQVLRHPGRVTNLAILANKNGKQGIWFIDINNIHHFNELEADIMLDVGAIHDIYWHRNGHILLFTADKDGVMNLFEYHQNSDTIYQLTHHKYGIMEGSYSPCGSYLSAIQINDNRFELVVFEYKNLNPTDVDASFIKRSNSHVYTYPTAGISSKEEEDNWVNKPYKTGFSWLKPRIFSPYFDYNDRYVKSRFGISLSSGDVLRKNSYEATFTTSNRRFWYAFDYRYSGSYPGFMLSVENKPVPTISDLYESRNATFSIPFNFRFDHNNRHTSLNLKPGITIADWRKITLNGQPTDDWIRRITTSLDVIYRYKLQQNIRDIQPNTGWMLFSELHWDVYSDFEFSHSRALRSGIYKFLSFNLGSNQSLRLGIESLNQNRPVFDVSGFFSRAFDDSIMRYENNVLRFNSRYTIPVLHLDKGNITIPFYLDRVYMVLFTDTFVSLDTSEFQTLYNQSRTVFGTGLRMQSRLFNFPLDIGIAFAYEITRHRSTFFIDSF